MIVVLDIGKVLVRWNPRNLFRKVFDDEARMERFLAAALAMDFIVLTDIVKDFSRAVAERAKAFPEFAEQLKVFDTRWIETIGGPVEENVALMRRLKRAGRPVYGLSNFASEKFALARKMFDFLNEFDACVISGDVGVVKPDPRIFEKIAAAPGDMRSSWRSSPTRPIRNAPSAWGGWTTRTSTPRRSISKEPTVTSPPKPSEADQSEPRRTRGLFSRKRSRRKRAQALAFAFIINM